MNADIDPDEAPSPDPERTSIDLDFETAMRALLDVDPTDRGGAE